MGFAGASEHFALRFALHFALHFAPGFALRFAPPQDDGAAKPLATWHRGDRAPLTCIPQMGSVISLLNLSRRSLSGRPAAVSLAWLC
jgi:hypothetical protein